MRRHFAAVSVVTLVSLGSLTIISTPAAATGQCDHPALYAAGAGADLLRVRALDLHPLGLPLPPVADVTIGSAKAGMSATSAVKSAATGEYANARVLGLKVPNGPLESRVYQQAPPSNQSPVRDTALNLDLGLVRAGTGEVTAHAMWSEGMACGRQTGQGGHGTAALADATLLGGARGALLNAPRNLSSQAVTGTMVRQGRTTSVAGAEIALTRLELLGGNINIKVIEPPQLKVYATGSAASSAVEYTSPVLEISGPGIPRQRLSGLHRTIEVAVPATGTGVLSGASATAARKRAKSEGIGLLSTGNPLSSLVGGLPIGDLTGMLGGLGDSRSTSAGPALPALPELDGLPVLGDLLGGVLNNSALDSSGAPAGKGAEIAVVRITIGELQQHIADRGVTASAASLRVQLLALGTGRGKRTPVLDLGIGMLQASATAPRSTTATASASPSPRVTWSPSTPPGKDDGVDTTPVAQTSDDCDSPGCTLPHTGTNIAVIAGVGALLAVAGRFLLLLTRRRAAEGPGDLLG